MKAKDILTNLNYEIISGNLDVIGREVIIDSREVKENSVFVCIDGLNVDGHTFIDKAVDNGASIIVVEKDVVVNDKSVLCVKVKSTREALSVCASNINDNPSEKFDLIGVTGTNGKTSTTYFIEQILRGHNKKTGVIGTTGGMINGKAIDVTFDTSTTPDAHHLQNIFHIMGNEKVDIVVMEVTSQGLHQKRVNNTKFNVSVLTNITQDHLDYHGTMDNYVDAKLDLFRMSEKAVINADDSYAEKFITVSKEYMTYSIDNKSDLQAKNIVYTGEGVSFDIDVKGSLENISVKVPGRFTVYNVLGAIGSLIMMGMEFCDIKNSLKNVAEVPGRIQNIKNSRGISVLVDYAHSPDGLDNIIKAVREFTTGKVITVFGCGGDRDKTKRPIMGEIAGNLSDYAIVTSDNPRTEEPTQITEEVAVGVKRTSCKYEIIVDRKEAITKAIYMAQKGDSVIIAGKGHEDYQIFGTTKVHFDDSQVAKEVLGE